MGFDKPESQNGVIDPRHILSALNDTPFGVQLHRGKEGMYRGETSLLGRKGLAYHTILDVEPTPQGCAVFANNVPVGSLPAMPDEETVILTYKQCDQRIMLLDVLPLKRETLEALVSAVIPEASVGQDVIRLEVDQTPRVVSPELLQSNPSLYLAQGIERRVQEQRLYDYDSRVIIFPDPIGRVSLDDTIALWKAGKFLGRTEAAVYQWLISKQPLVSGNYHLNAPDVLCVSLCDISSKKKYTHDEIAAFFGVTREDIAVVYPTFFRTHSHQAYLVRKQFRCTFDVMLHAWKKGESLLSPPQYLDQNGVIALLRDEGHMNDMQAIIRLCREQDAVFRASNSSPENTYDPRHVRAYLATLQQ